jgi:malonate decarboxylase beta subunit
MSLNITHEDLTVFHELSPRERLAALLDGGRFTELTGPFDRIHSLWLLQQGLVPQSDDGVVVVRGSIEGEDLVGIAIEGSFEGGSIGEVGGAKIATALELAATSCRNGRPVAALLLLETGGVRLQESILGLAAISAIQSALIDLRELTAVVVVIAGPVGCFGGMSLAAELCTYLIGTPHGRLGMNGPEVIEQEAGADEIDASDREAIWQLVGCEARARDGWIDKFVQDNLDEISEAVREGLAKGPGIPSRTTRAAKDLERLRIEIDNAGARSKQMDAVPSRGLTWLKELSDSSFSHALETPSVLTANIQLPGIQEHAFAISIVPDADSKLPRAAHGELGLEQGWALAACIEQFVVECNGSGTKRPIIAIIDTPGQAFGRIEEERCISAAAASAVDAYARARRAGHPVLTLVVGRAVSGSFLAHGLQSDHIFALDDQDVSMYAMSAQSIARVTRRTIDEVQFIAAASMPRSFKISDAHLLGVIDTLIPGINAENPMPEDIEQVKCCLADALSAYRNGSSTRSSLAENPYRQSTKKVQDAMRLQWSLLPDTMASANSSDHAGQAVEA